MSWIGKILLNILLWGLLRKAESSIPDTEVEKQAKSLRRYAEDRLHTLATRKQQGSLGKTDLDDKGLKFAQVFMKSRWLDQKLAYDKAMYPAH